MVYINLHDNENIYVNAATPRQHTFLISLERTKGVIYG